MEEIAISEFKARCLALVDEVNKTKRPIRITRHGKAIAEVVPVGPSPAKQDWMGSMKDAIQIKGDIVSPVIDLEDFEAHRD